MLLAIKSFLERGPASVRYDLLPVAGFFQAGIQLHFPPAMPEKPTPGVVGLVDGDPVNPRLERALPAEIPDVPKNFQKDFLNYIARFRLIVQQPQRQRVNRLLESRKQLFVSRLG